MSALCDKVAGTVPHTNLFFDGSGSFCREERVAFSNLFIDHDTGTGHFRNGSAVFCKFSFQSEPAAEIFQHGQFDLECTFGILGQCDSLFSFGNKLVVKVKDLPCKIHFLSGSSVFLELDGVGHLFAGIVDPSVDRSGKSAFQGDHILCSRSFRLSADSAEIDIVDPAGSLCASETVDADEKSCLGCACRDLDLFAEVSPFCRRTVPCVADGKEFLFAVFDFGKFQNEFCDIVVVITCTFHPAGEFHFFHAVQRKIFAVADVADMSLCPIHLHGSGSACSLRNCLVQSRLKPYFCVTALPVGGSPRRKSFLEAVVFHEILCAETEQQSGSQQSCQKFCF